MGTTFHEASVVIAASAVFFLISCGRQEELPVLFSSWNPGEIKHCQEVTQDAPPLQYRGLLCGDDFQVQWLKADTMKEVYNGKPNPALANPTKAAMLNDLQTNLLRDGARYRVTFVGGEDPRNQPEAFGRRIIYWNCEKHEDIKCRPL